MDIQFYKRKYLESGFVCFESLVIDMAIELVTEIEIKNKFETHYLEFKNIGRNLKEDFDKLKDFNTKLTDGTWNKFYAAVFTQLREFLYNNKPKLDGFPNYYNAYDNAPDDADFFCYISDEVLNKNKEGIKPEMYIPDYSCYSVLEALIDSTDIDLIDLYEKKVSVSDDIYELTLAKNRCLFLIDHEEVINKKSLEIAKNKSYKVIPVAELELSQAADPEKKEWKKPTVVTIDQSQVDDNEEQKEKEPNDKIEFKYDSKIDTIKDMLIDNLKEIKSGALEVARANSFNSTVQTYINMSRIQLDFMKFIHGIK